MILNYLSTFSSLSSLHLTKMLLIIISVINILTGEAVPNDGDAREGSHQIRGGHGLKNDHRVTETLFSDMASAAYCGGRYSRG